MRRPCRAVRLLACCLWRELPGPCPPGAVTTCKCGRLCSVSPLSATPSRLVVSKIETPALHCTALHVSSASAIPRNRCRSAARFRQQHGCFASDRFVLFGSQDESETRREMEEIIAAFAAKYPERGLFLFLGRCCQCHGSKLRLRPSALRTSFGFSSFRKEPCTRNKS